MAGFIAKDRSVQNLAEESGLIEVRRSNWHTECQKQVQDASAVVVVRCTRTLQLGRRYSRFQGWCRTAQGPFAAFASSAVADELSEAGDVRGRAIARTWRCDSSISESARAIQEGLIVGV